MTDNQNGLPTSSIDELELQRLVDDRLSDEEVACLIEWVDESASLGNDQAWRNVAMAYIENQTLTRALVGDKIATVSDNGSVHLRKSPTERLTTWTLALACGLLIAAFSFSMGSRSGSPVETSVAERTQSTNDDVFSGGFPAQPVNPNSQSMGPGRSSQSLQYLTSTLSKPLIGDEARQMLAEQGVLSFESPVIYVVEGPDGTNYVIPNREAVLISHQR